MTGDHLYAWQARADEGWYLIGADIDGRAFALISRSRDVAETELRAFAEAHHRETGSPIRLGMFKLSTVLKLDR